MGGRGENQADVSNSSLPIAGPPATTEKLRTGEYSGLTPPFPYGTEIQMRQLEQEAFLGSPEILHVFTAAKTELLEWLRNSSGRNLLLNVSQKDAFKIPASLCSEKVSVDFSH